MLSSSESCRRIACALVVSLGFSIVSAQETTQESLRIDRLVALAKLWAAIKYFHPYLAYRDNIDWDAALVTAIPKVNSAKGPADYSAAVAEMLGALGDPATRVLSLPEAKAGNSPSDGKRPFFKTDADGVLVVSMTNYADFEGFGATREKFAALKAEIPKARAIVFDLRPRTVPSEDEQGAAANSIQDGGIAGLLTSTTLAVPGERRRMYLGHAPEDGSSSGDYSSGFYVQGRRSIEPEQGEKNIPVIFVVGPHADLPPLAISLQAAGTGAVIAEGEASDEAVVSTLPVHLTDGVTAQVRLGELVYEDGTSGFTPNLTVPVSNLTDEKNPAFQAAMRLAREGQFEPEKRTRLIERASPLKDKTYAEMDYPSEPYRVLAAFRLWAVIDNFYPYKESMGEDWDDVLRKFIPRMERAKDALDYNLTAVEMATHIHDTHAFYRSKILKQHFGDATLPVRIRSIEGFPTITGYTDAKAAADAGLEIGDVILKVNGVDASQLIAEDLKYRPHSTPQSGMFFATERGVALGAKDSVATLTVRDLHDKVRDVKVARKTEYLSKLQGDRSGEAVRILPGNIGYVDLDRLSPPRVDEMFEKFKNCPGIIFDDRGYPQGTAWQIAPRLTDKSDVVAALFKRKDPMAPNLPNGELEHSQVTESFGQRLPRTEKWRYHGKTVLLIDERTISQAEHTGLFFEAANGTKFVGSATQGANGDVTNLSLPGGIYVYFSGQGVWHADGRPLQRLGLQPDVEVHPTLAGIRAGKDEVLDKAVEFLQQELKASK